MTWERNVSRHLCSALIHHLFPLLIDVLAAGGLRGCRGTRLFFGCLKVVNGLFPPVQILRHGQFDPVGEVLQRAVVEAAAVAEGSGKHERGPTLEGLPVGPDVLIHVRVDGRPR